MRLRSIVAINAGGEMDAALASQADAIALVLNDADQPVHGLRTAAAAAIGQVRDAGKHALATVNHPRTRLLRDDIEAIVAPGLSGVFLPHACEPQDVRDLAVLLREFELARGLEPGAIVVFPVIETARGLLRAAEIAAAAPRTAGLLFDSDAYANDVGARSEESGPRLAYARGAVVAAARACDVVPLVVTGGAEVHFLAQHGFGGALLPGPGFVAQANAAFSPSPAVVERAGRELAAYDAARGEGAWVARTGRRIVDSHSARKARSLLE
ncbi:MAG: hypothetical protein HS107_06005 [Thermoflexaceae bacterium]|nr:hypothetical protein [Thermoflexaceae bacterium]